MQILTCPDERLREVRRPDFTVPLSLIPAMFKLMLKSGSVGLAAPQVGVDARLFITGWGEVFINPSYTSEDPCLPVQEGRLSVPDCIGIRALRQGGGGAGIAAARSLGC